MASNRIALPDRGIASAPLIKGAMATIAIDLAPLWRHRNGNAFGLFLKCKAELKQADAAFVAVEGLGRFGVPLNLALIFRVEGVAG